MIKEFKAVRYSGCGSSKKTKLEVAADSYRISNDKCFLANDDICIDVNHDDTSKTESSVSLAAVIIFIVVIFGLIVIMAMMAKVCRLSLPVV